MQNQDQDDAYLRDRMVQICNAEAEIKTRQNLFEKALYNFSEAVDKLKNPLTEEEHITRAQEIIAQTEELLIKLGIKKQQLSSTLERTHFGKLGSPPGNSISPVIGIELPQLPLPKFSGKVWQWDSFWELFNGTVHTLPISNLQKFNYLRESLKGEARDSISRFQVTSANYNLAVAHLKEKYGNVQNIVTNLHQQLEQWSARSSYLKDQRKLFDQLSAITAQLESKGGNLESPWLLSKLLCKFTVTIQRRTLRGKIFLLQQETWTLKKRVTTLDKVIKQEEEIEQSMPKRRENPPETTETSKGTAGMRKKRTTFCFYCDSQEHRSTESQK
ncbi:peptidase family A16 [Ostertagia ostertagi]